jgi:predicted ArsR family transcriptional regulator
VPAIEEIANSRARLTIASLISSRPRTLGELAETTGISVQGVLKHLKKLSEAGMLKVKSIPAGRYLRSRKIYYIDTRRVADYSRGDMIVATLGDESGGGDDATEDTAEAMATGDPYAELDRLAQDIILLRRRARELSIRMKHMTEEVTENESRIAKLIEGLELSPEEKQIAYLIFGDDRPEQARRILKEHYGCRNPEAAIGDVAEKIRGGGA